MAYYRERPVLSTVKTAETMLKSCFLLYPGKSMWWKKYLFAWKASFYRSSLLTWQIHYRKWHSCACTTWCSDMDAICNAKLVAMQASHITPDPLPDHVWEISSDVPPFNDNMVPLPLKETSHYNWDLLVFSYCKKWSKSEESEGLSKWEWDTWNSITPYRGMAEKVTLAAIYLSVSGTCVVIRPWFALSQSGKETIARWAECSWPLCTTGRVGHGKGRMLTSYLQATVGVCGRAVLECQYIH